MKAIILERKGEWAAVLFEDGTIDKVKLSGGVGETVELNARVTGISARRNRWRRSAVAAAIAVCVIAGSFAYVTVPASAYVSLDVGETAVEIQVNRLGRVIGVDAVNEDDVQFADELRGMIRGQRLEEAIPVAMDRFDKGGYLDAEDGFMIAGVTAGNEKQGERFAGFINDAAREMRPDMEFYMMDVPKDDRGSARGAEMSGGRYMFERQGGRPDMNGRPVPPQAPGSAGPAPVPGQPPEGNRPPA